MPGYAKGTTRQQQIVELCIKLISTNGVAALSFESIARELSLNRAHIKYYFESKEQLLLAAFEDIAKTAQAITIEYLETCHTWQARLRAIVDGAFAWISKHPDHAAVLNLYYHYCCVNDCLAERQIEIRQIGRERIQAILTAGLGKKISKRQAEHTAYQLQIFLTGLILEMCTSNQLKKSKEYSRMAHDFIEQMVSTLQK